MTDNEVIELFWNKLSSCYRVKHLNYSEHIYWFYDKSYERKFKLNKLNNQDTTPNIAVKGICLFKEIPSNNMLLWNYDKIWNEIDNKNHATLTDFYNIKRLIEKMLKDRCHISNYNSGDFFEVFTDEIFEYDKLTII